MAVQENTNLTTDFAKAQSIDFVNRFTGGIKKLQEMLGITIRQGLSEGSTIKTYKSSVTLADGNVAEGDLIPLSKVEKTLDKTYELADTKYRRAVTLEAIQRSGFDQAVQEADTALLRKIQSNIRTDFAAFLATGTGTAAGNTMQAVVADAWAKLQVLKGHRSGKPDGRFGLSGQFGHHHTERVRHDLFQGVSGRIHDDKRQRAQGQDLCHCFG